MSQKTIQVGVDTDWAETMEDVDIVRCSLCGAINPYNLGDESWEWQYQCDGCGAIFVVLRGRQDIEED